MSRTRGHDDVSREVELGRLERLYARHSPEPVRSGGPLPALSEVAGPTTGLRPGGWPASR